jgi:cysteine desulfurase
MDRVYLDHNATTRPAPEVVELMARLFGETFGNPSSQHRQGQQAKAVLEQARARAAELVGASPREIVFCGSGTESDIIAIRGALGRAPVRSGAARLIISPIEHDAVEQTARALEKEGVGVTRLPVDGRGLVDPESLRRAIGPETGLVSVIHASSETGVVQPVAELAAICREAGVPFHSDAVQAAGKLPLSARELGADLLSLSAHKFHGPKGCGLLYVRSGVRLAPLLVGGGQERGLRAGTENVPLLAGAGEAARLALEQQEETRTRLEGLRDRLEERVLDTIPGTSVHGRGAPRLANTTSLAVSGLEGDTLAINLDLKGFAVSTGSACSSTSPEPSRILSAMGLPEEVNRSTIRISTGRNTTAERLDAFADGLAEVVERLRRMTGGRGSKR